MIVIGSVALSYHLSGIVPKDLDIVGTYDEIVEFRKAFGAVTFYPINQGKTIFMRNAQGRICEAEVAWEGSMAEKLIDFVANNGYWSEVSTVEGYPCFIPCLDILYLLKMSHRYKKDSPHFLKTMRDIHMLRKLGAEIRPSHQEFYKQRMKDTYSYAHPRLNTSKEGFFDAEATGVVYTYDHDSIHAAVAELRKPAYTYFKPKDSPVMVSKEMWDNQVEEIRLYSVLEEAYVLALERSLIPYPNGKTPKEAFDMALMKVCTSITSGWWREYAWESYDSVQALYSDSYVDKFQQGLESGVVKPFDKTKATY
jgi:hypothetical protein